MTGSTIKSNSLIFVSRFRFSSLISPSNIKIPKNSAPIAFAWKFADTGIATIMTRISLRSFGAKPGCLIANETKYKYPMANGVQKRFTRMLTNMSHLNYKRMDLKREILHRELSYLLNSVTFASANGIGSAFILMATMFDGASTRTETDKMARRVRADRFLSHHPAALCHVLCKLRMLNACEYINVHCRRWSLLWPLLS